ncbi:hypothetical protein [Gracilibacillus phocaeensis]|nr:hypothetical protein [Gracilibacillus phocaeensis]
MNGLEVFLIVGLISVILSFFICRSIKNKQQKSYTFMIPPIVVTVIVVLGMIISIFLIPDGWVILSNAFFALVIIIGAFLGSLLVALTK